MRIFEKRFQICALLYKVCQLKPIVPWDPEESCVASNMSTMHPLSHLWGLRLKKIKLYHLMATDNVRVLCSCFFLIFIVLYLTS